MGVESRLGQDSTAWMNPTATPRAPSSRGRILVVDDEPMIGMAIRRTLQREHDVVLVTSAREACRRVAGGERFDLVLSDVMMPEMSGVELYQELTRMAPEQAARMVFLTGDAFTPYARSFLGGVDNHRMEKPFSSEALRDLVRTLLAPPPAGPRPEPV